LVKMNKNNQMILNDSDVISCWLTDNDLSEGTFYDIEPINIYNGWCKKYDLDDSVIVAHSENISSNYLEECLDNWHMPEEYKTLDIKKYLLDLTTDQNQFNRVKYELSLFTDRGMIIVLKFLKYLVDTCKENDIVLGVGRGSSVASYCLYLLGVHKIDSLKYELDIKEFLK